jgi:hypothetical protein
LAWSGTQTRDARIEIAQFTGLAKGCRGAIHLAFETISSRKPPKPAKPEPNRRAKTKLVLGRAGNFG